jgi:hypothetical protein
VILSVPNGAYAVTAGAAVGTVIIVAAAERGKVGRTGYGLNTGLRIGGGKVGNGGIKGLMENG